MAVWQCGVCEGINNGGTTCATCGAVIPPGVSPPPPAPPPAAPPRNVSPRSAPPPGASPPPPSPSPPPGSRPARPPVRLARPRSAAPRPAPPGAPPRPRPRPRPRPGTRAPWPPPGGWYEPAARPAPRRRPVAWLVRSLALLVVLVAWAYPASYAPGLAPRSMASMGHHLLPLPSSTDCPAPPCPSGSGAQALSVAFDGDDTLVLLARRSTAPDRIVVAFERSARTLTLDRGGSGAGWTVTDPRGVRYPTLAADDRGVLALRVPGPPPAPRWAATVAGERVPSRGFAPVARPPRPRDALLDNPAASVIVALFVALVVAPRGYRTASRRVLRAGLRALLFGLAVVVGLRPLVSALHAAAVAPGLVVAAILLAVPAVVLALAVRLGDVVPAGRTPDVDVGTPVRAATAVVAVALVAVLGYAGEGALARFVPGLTL